METDRYKILGGILALRRFTITELATYSAVKRHSIAEWIARHRDILEEIQFKEVRGRGRSGSTWRLKDDAVDGIRNELIQLWPAVATVVLRESGVDPDLTQLTTLTTAEAYFKAAAATDEASVAAEYYASAQAWVQAAREEVDEWRYAGIEAPNTLVQRITDIERALKDNTPSATPSTSIRHLDALRNLWSVTEYSNWLLDSLSTSFASSDCLNQTTSAIDVDDPIDSVLKRIEVAVATLGNDQRNLFYCSLVAAFGYCILNQHPVAVRIGLRTLMERNHSKLVSGLYALIYEESLGEIQPDEIEDILIGLSKNPDIAHDESVRHWLEKLRLLPCWRPDFAPSYLEAMVNAPGIHWGRLVDSLQSDLEHAITHYGHDAVYQRPYRRESVKDQIAFVQRALNIRGYAAEGLQTLEHLAKTFSTDASQRAA